MEFLVALLVAVVIGLIVKVVLGFFDLTRPYADALGLLAAAIYFLTRVM